MQELFSFAESNELRSISLGFNNLASFSRYLDNQPVFKQAQNEFLSNPRDAHDRLLDRVRTLLATSSNAAYLHNYDAAIAVYLYLIYKLDGQSIERFTSEVQSKNLHNLWWTRHLLGIIRQSPKQEVTITPSVKFHYAHTSTGKFISSANTITDSHTINTTNEARGVVRHA